MVEYKEQFSYLFKKTWNAHSSVWELDFAQGNRSSKDCKIRTKCMKICNMPPGIIGRPWGGDGGKEEQEKKGKYIPTRAQLLHSLKILTKIVMIIMKDYTLSQYFWKLSRKDPPPIGQLRLFSPCISVFCYLQSRQMVSTKGRTWLWALLVEPAFSGQFGSWTLVLCTPLSDMYQGESS